MLPQKGDPAYFYPRPPRGGRPLFPPPCRCRGYFYPRPPRGGRQASSLTVSSTSLFLSTPSARRATKTVGDRHKALEISIHALREEGDI